MHILHVPFTCRADLADVRNPVATALMRSRG
jgi:hypothetical protein